MKETYGVSELRNFVVVGHASAGKTILCEAMLLCSGRIGRLGSIAAGTTVSDYHASEHEHRISVHASLLHTEWLGRKFNLVDTPGYADFISEGIGALRVGDCALVVVNAAHGLGVGTDAVWDYATHYGLPKILAVNALDKPNTDFDDGRGRGPRALRQAGLPARRSRSRPDPAFAGSSTCSAARS